MAVKAGRVTAMDVDGMLDAGAFITSSGDVLHRFTCTFPGIYSIPSVKVRCRAMKTNTPPCGAFRGFGAPQSIFAIDTAMRHLAKEQGEDETEFRRRHFASKGSVSPTGGKYYYDVPLERMIEMADKSTSYFKKREQYSHQNSGRLKSGIGIAFSNHGFPLGGDVEWKYIKPRAKLVKHADGTVEIYTAQCELGQGIRTAFSKIAAETLGIPYDNVSTYYPDTDTTYPTGPTAASRSVAAVGRVVKEAAQKLKEIWKDGEEQEAEAEYTKPEHVTEEFDSEKIIGSQYDDYSWSVIVVEVSIDPLTGNIKIVNAHAVYNLGTPIDENILRGQMEGGLLQALGYSATERIVIGSNGKMFNTAFSDYHIPTSTDMPNISVEFEYTEYPVGPYGAKGAGELPLSGVSSAYAMAVEQALGKIRPAKLAKVPFVPEDVIETIIGTGGENG